MKIQVSLQPLENQQLVPKPRGEPEWSLLAEMEGRQVVEHPGEIEVKEKEDNQPEAGGHGIENLHEDVVAVFDLINDAQPEEDQANDQVWNQVKYEYAFCCVL